jgi:hypothetical protein
MEYLVNVSKTANYDFVLRAASSTDGNQFHLEVDEVDVTGIKTINNLGGIQTYFDIKNTISLTQGKHMVRLVIDKATGGFNLNKMVFTAATTTGLEDEESSNLISVYPNPASEFVTVVNKRDEESKIELTNMLGITIWTGRMLEKEHVIDLSGLSNGVYILRSNNKSFKLTIRK